jgi:hypothetical protein
VLATALVVAQTGCANTLEGVGGTAVAVGGGMFVVGLAPPVTRNCDSPRTPCYRGGAQVYGEVTTYSRQNVPLMISDIALAATGVALWVTGFSQRKPRFSSPAPAAARSRSAGAKADPEAPVLEK